MKRSKIFLIFSILLSILLVAAAGVALYQIYTLQVLPSTLLVPVCIIIVLIVAILLLLLMDHSDHIWSKLINTILVLACTAAMVVGNLYLYQTKSFFSSVTSNSGNVKNVVSVITLKSSNIEDVEDLNGKIIGSLKKIDKNGTKKSKKDLKSKNVTYTSKTYDSVQKEVKALYNKKVDAIILNEAYRSNVEDIEDYSDFSQKTKTVLQTEFYTKDSNEALAVSDITTKPFTILISGNDDYGDLEEVSRSDVNLLVTVNPNTNRVLMTSVPRDYYVEVTCSDNACNAGSMDKLTHTGMSGVDTTKETLENLLDIDINYTYRVNFSSAEKIVDALGGVDIEVPEGMAVKTFYADSTLEGVQEGWNHLDGARALAYSRERHAYTNGDIQRAKNQQQVLEAIIDKATSSKVLTNYTELLDAMSDAFETNMSMNEITTLLRYQLQSSPKWKFENFVLDGVADEQYCAEIGDVASVLVPDDAYVQAAHGKIEAVVNGKKASSVELKDPDPNDYGASQEEGVDETEQSALEQGLISEEPETTETYTDQTYTDTTTYDPNQVVQ